MQKVQCRGQIYSYTKLFKFSCLHSLFYSSCPLLPSSISIFFQCQFPTTPLPINLSPRPGSLYLKFLPSPVPFLSLCLSFSLRGEVIERWVAGCSSVVLQRSRGLSQLPPPSCRHPSPLAHTDWEETALLSAPDQHARLTPKSIVQQNLNVKIMHRGT